MKKMLLTLAGIFLMAGIFAQSNKEEIDFFQSMFGMEKKAIVAEFVKPNETQKDAFWNLYDEYEVQRKDLGKQRIQLLEKYADQYNGMTGEQADAFMKEMMTLSSKTDKLVNTYYLKVKKVTDPIVAMQFYQIEAYILTAIRFSILDSLPFLGEFTK